MLAQVGEAEVVDDIARADEHAATVLAQQLEVVAVRCIPSAIH